jgi:hypothetical protein
MTPHNNGDHGMTNTPRTRRAQGHPQSAPQVSRTKEFNRRRFIWLDQVMADRELTASVFKVAYNLGQRFNEREGGAAWPSVRTISETVGLSKSVVLDAVRLLQDRGHLEIQAGRQGRGHSNRYMMLLKGRQDDLSDAAAKGRIAKIKGRKTPGKGRPTGLNLSTHPRGSKEPPRMRERTELSLVSVAGRLDGAAPDLGKEDSYIDLRRVWDRGWIKDNTSKVVAATRCAYAAARREATGAEILDGARAWVEAADAPRFLPALDDWLASCGWRSSPPKRGRTRTASVSGADIARQWANHTESRMESWQ